MTITKVDPAPRYRIEDTIMSGFSTRPRILFVTPEAAFNPKTGGPRKHAISTNAYGFYHFPVALISDLFHYNVDVYVAQPDYSRLFPIIARKEHANSSFELPIDHLYLAKDRAFSYANLIELNPEWENIKVSLAFQREVIHQIIPRVQPDLIHCHDWMTGLIPAAAKKIEIPCLFTVQKIDTARSLLSCVEDIGIDAAGFWQNLFYDRYPGSYEQTRATTPLDLLLSGILAASHVSTSDTVLLPHLAKDRRDFMSSPMGQLLAQKWKAGCVCEIPGPQHISLNSTNNKKLDCRNRPKDSPAVNPKNHRAERQSNSSSNNQITAKSYIDLYETILQRPLVTPENERVLPIYKNNHTKALSVQAIPYPGAHRTRSYALVNEQISTLTLAPI